MICSAPLSAQTAEELTPRTPDIPYRVDGHERQVLDVYLPDDRSEKLSTLFIVHGGGFVGGQKEMVRPVAEYFTGQGYAVVTPNYRLAPQNTFPAAIEDVFCALAWTYANADTYGFDVSRIVTIGESAGGNAVAMLGTVDEPETFLTDCAYDLTDVPSLQGVVAYYMPADLDCNCRGAQRFASAYLGVSWDSEMDTVREQWAAAIPGTYLTGDEPPFLLIHGTDDSLVPLSESQTFFQQAVDLIDIELIEIGGADHGFFIRLNQPETQIALDEVERFLADVLPE